MLMKNKKKYILSAISAAILAFIIEKLFDPVLETLYSSFLKLGSFFIKSFSDSVYRSISNGFCEEPSMLSLSALTLLMFFAMNIVSKKYLQRTYSSTRYLKKIDAVTKISKNNENSKENSVSPLDTNEEALTSEKIRKFANETKKQLEFFGTSTLILLIFSCFFLFFVYSKQIFINSAVTKALSNIEIVSPYISDIEYKQLKSSFYTIENKEDYDSLIEKLEDIADENSIKLKE